jgi:hypothetical protein
MQSYLRILKRKLSVVNSATYDKENDAHPELVHAVAEAVTFAREAGIPAQVLVTNTGRSSCPTDPLQFLCNDIAAALTESGEQLTAEVQVAAENVWKLTISSKPKQS